MTLWDNWKKYLLGHAIGVYSVALVFVFVYILDTIQYGRNFDVIFITCFSVVLLSLLVIFILGFTIYREYRKPYLKYGAFISFHGMYVMLWFSLFIDTEGFTSEQFFLPPLLLFVIVGVVVSVIAVLIRQRSQGTIKETYRLFIQFLDKFIVYVNTFIYSSILVVLYVVLVLKDYGYTDSVRAVFALYLVLSTLLITNLVVRRVWKEIPLIMATLLITFAMFLQAFSTTTYWTFDEYQVIDTVFLILSMLGVVFAIFSLFLVYQKKLYCTNQVYFFVVLLTNYLFLNMETRMVQSNHHLRVYLFKVTHEVHLFLVMIIPLFLVFLSLRLFVQSRQESLDV